MDPESSKCRAQLVLGIARIHFETQGVCAQGKDALLDALDVVDERAAVSDFLGGLEDANVVSHKRRPRLSSQAHHETSFVTLCYIVTLQSALCWLADCENIALQAASWLVPTIGFEAMPYPTTSELRVSILTSQLHNISLRMRHMPCCRVPSNPAKAAPRTALIELQAERSANGDHTLHVSWISICVALIACDRAILLIDSNSLNNTLHSL